MPLKFTWNERKRRINLETHHLDFADAHSVFAGATFTFEDDRIDYGEQRFITIGMLKNVVVVITHLESGDDVRLISMRKASKHEQEIFFRGFAD
jgi:uncharacterized DUF497 family protein